LSKTGKDWAISMGAASYMGGIILDADAEQRGRTFSEAGTGQRALATEPMVTEALPVLRFTMNIQRITDYINTKAIIDAEGAVPATTLYTDDGTNDHDLTASKVNTCEVRVRRGESIKAILEVIGKTWGTETYVAGVAREEQPTDWTKATITIGSAITNWRMFNMLVNNNVASEFLGTGVTPSDVFERQALYSGRVERSITGARKFDKVSTPTKEDVVIAITDYQSTPVTKTYTFDKAAIKTSRVRVPALNLDIETIEWECGDLDIP